MTVHTQRPVAPAAPAAPVAPVAPAAPVEAPVVHTQRPAAPAPEAPVQPKPVHTQRPVAAPAAPAAPVAPAQPKPVHTQRPAAPVKPVEPIAEDGEALAPADYTTVNIILLVVSLLSCCTCISIPAIITSIIGVVSGSACKKAIAAGNMELAAKKSKTAKTLWIVSAVILALAIIAGAVVLLLSFAGNGSAMMLEDMMSKLNP